MRHSFYEHAPFHNFSMWTEIIETIVCNVSYFGSEFISDGTQTTRKEGGLQFVCMGKVNGRIAKVDPTFKTLLQFVTNF